MKLVYAHEAMDRQVREDFELLTTGVSKGDFALSSKFLNADEFLSEKQRNTTSDTSPQVIEKGAIVLPKI
ncbi:hypothetical protein [Flavobacterium sp.]|uniref:hypothetical protein n=1 Tax=Flavobacterium sp. TaxID=239 RepID=UPI0026216C7D|nr:hypothetical protein [Flavobacterium sp.]